MFNRPLLGEILIERGAARPDDIEQSLQIQEEKGGRPRVIYVSIRVVWVG